MRAEPNAYTDDVSAASRLMEGELQEVDAVITQRLASQVALVNQIAGYITGAGGKRVRPLLVLLFSNALGFRGAERFELAATVEFIHTATLLHDDVVDESELRRGKRPPTRSSATQPAFWSETSSIRAPFR